MATAKVFVRAIQDIQISEIPDHYTIQMEVMAVGVQSDAYAISFTAPWGADWRLLARQAIAEWAMAVRGEEIDGVVFLDFSVM